MMSHQTKEMQKLLNYGTPSERLIKTSEKYIVMKFEGRPRGVCFPVSLNKTAGQKLLFKVAKSVSSRLKTVPIQAHQVLEQLQATITHRRKDTQSNILMVAESVLHRAATEFKHEVIFAFDSINTWIKSVYGKELGYHTIRRALETLESTEFFIVNEWGQRGARDKATKIEFVPTLLPKEVILTYTSKIDDWLLFNDHAMTKVYARENVTRLDVLEARIHHYAEELVAEELLVRPGPVRKLFPERQVVVVADVAVTEEVSIEENGVWTDVYVDRLLGGLVPAMQETVTVTRQGGRRLRFSELAEIGRRRQ